jgi:hypothetical protein
MSRSHAHINLLEHIETLKITPDYHDTVLLFSAFWAFGDGTDATVTIKSTRTLDSVYNIKKQKRVSI